MILPALFMGCHGSAGPLQRTGGLKDPVPGIVKVLFCPVLVHRCGAELPVDRPQPVGSIRQCQTFRLPGHASFLLLQLPETALGPVQLFKELPFQLAGRILFLRCGQGPGSGFRFLLCLCQGYFQGRALFRQ